ncbi:hypothetical protein Tco_0100792 [Tanacetum coccineum]
MPYLGELSKVDDVDRSLDEREKAIDLLKFHLSRAQDRMKQEAHKKIGQIEFKCDGDHQTMVQAALPQMDKEGLIGVEPMVILKMKIVKKRNVVAVYDLMQWTNEGPQDAT